MMRNVIWRPKFTPPSVRFMSIMMMKKTVNCSRINGNINPQSVFDHIMTGHDAQTSVLSPLRHIHDACRPFSIEKSQTMIAYRQQQQPSLFPAVLSTAMNTRSYTTTPVVSLAIGRRRRQHVSGGLGGDDDESTTKTDAITTNNKSVNVKIEPKVFLSHVTALYDTVHKAMVPLIPINEVMILTRGESSREMHEEEERREQEEKKRARKEMKDKNETEGETSGKRKSNENDDDEREPVSVQSLGDHRIIDGPYLKIELGPIHGQYTFVADVEYNSILFQSPISGQLTYYYDIQNTHEWINVHDQHNLIGMFVRDIIRQIQGVPKI
jgi:hypothetical protein